MKAIIALFFSILLLIPRSVDAQNDTIVTKVTTYDNVEPKDAPQPKLYYKHLIKLHLTEIIFGDVPIYYERAFSPKFSGEIGLGITIFDFYHNYFNEPDLNLIPSDRKRNVMKYSYKVGLRYYVNHTAPDDFYTSIEYNYRNNAIEVTALNRDGLVSDRTILSEREVKELKIILGYQQQFSSSQAFYWDYYIGFGVRTISENKVEEVLVGSGNDSFYDYIISTPQSTRPSFHLGVKLSFAL